MKWIIRIALCIAIPLSYWIIYQQGRGRGSREGNEITEKTHRAHLEREKFGWPLVQPYAPMVGGESFLKARRWRDEQKSLAGLPRMSDIVSAGVFRTPDTGDITIELVDVDGKGCTIWTTGKDENRSLHVRSITN